MSKSKEELQQAAREDYKQKQREHQELLDAVKDGENALNVGETEIVSVGNVDVEVRAWMPGETKEKIVKAWRMADNSDRSDSSDDIMAGINTMIDGMVAVTESISHTTKQIRFDTEEDIRTFWNGMWSQWGINGFSAAVGKVLSPAIEAKQSESDAANGFRTDAEGAVIRAGNHGDRDATAKVHEPSRSGAETTDSPSNREDQTD